MPGDVGLLGALLRDPLALYPALAALVLASVSLATGLLRGDALALSRPVPVLWLIAAVAATWGIAFAATLAPTDLADAALGAARLPLYLFALAYGSVPGLVGAALVAAWVPLPHASAWGPWLLGLEVVVVGWLAVWPSPRTHRSTGPTYAVLAYALAWGTAGVGALTLERGDVTTPLLVEQHGLVPAGVLGAALLLALLGPRAYARAFPDSRIGPAPARDAARDRRAGPRRAADGGAEALAPGSVEAPPLLRRRRRARTLTPVPLAKDLEDLGS